MPAETYRKKQNIERKKYVVKLRYCDKATGFE